MSRRRTARCACGQLSVTVRGEPAGVGLCHCLDCQRRTGSVFAALASFRGPYEVSGRASVYRRTGDAGATFLFHFCPDCGATVFHSEEGHEGGIGVAVGAFGDPGFPPPQVSVYDCRRHGWVTLPPDTEAFEKDPP